MDYKLISIRNGAAGNRPSDQRCKRSKYIFPNPTIRFDLTGPRIVAVWNWSGVEAVDIPNGVKINVVPTLLLVTISCN